MDKPKVIVICGPTASGKTLLSVELAKILNAEIISCDSMQIYKDMTIGTAKPTVDVMQNIKHYLIDFVSPDQEYSVADYKKDAEKVIEKIISKGKIPIIVGGTGLYLDSLIYNIKYNETKVDINYRKELEKIIEQKGLEFLYKKAKEIDSEAVEKISVNDKKRIMRILEIYHTTGKTKTEQEIESRICESKYDYKIFAIDIERKILYDRINYRVDKMIEKGLIEEVQNLLKKYKMFPTAMQGLGYKEVLEYLNGDCKKEEMIENIKRQTRRYAKRQLTWFRKNKNTVWINGMNNMQDNIAIILEGINWKRQM